MGQIANVDVLYRENDLREILVLDLETKCKELADSDIDTMTYELSRWVKWVGTVDEKLQRAEERRGVRTPISHCREPFLPAPARIEWR